MYRVWLHNGCAVASVPKVVAEELIARFGYPVESFIHQDGSEIIITRKKGDTPTRLIRTSATTYGFKVPLPEGTLLSFPKLRKLTDDDFELVYRIDNRRE